MQQALGKAEQIWFTYSGQLYRSVCTTSKAKLIMTKEPHCWHCYKWRGFI